MTATMTRKLLAEGPCSAIINMAIAMDAAAIVAPPRTGDAKAYKAAIHKAACAMTDIAGALRDELELASR